MISTHRVLITAIGGNTAQGVLKALRAGVRKYTIVGTDAEPLSAGFAMADKSYVTPRTGTENYEEALAEIIRREKIEAVFVCSPPELDFFSRNKNRLEQILDVTILVNPTRTVQIGSDKLETARFLEKSGFAFPESCLASDESASAQLAEKFGFPLILKPRHGASSINVFRARSLDEIRTLRQLIPDLVVQRYLPDDRNEFTATTLSDPSGAVFACIVLRRHLLQGTTYRTELASDPGLAVEISGLAAKLENVGVCNFQFRLLEGRPCVFEINPRFSGTSGIRFRYGFNDPEMAFEMFRLGLVPPTPVLRPAVVLRYWDEICLPDSSFDSIRSIGIPARRHE